MADSEVHIRALGKSYHIGGQRERYRTLRDTMVDMAKRPVQRVIHPGAATGRTESFWALKDLSLDVAGGEVIGLIGPNGAGKTTLLKILSRVTLPTEGTVVGRGRIGSLLQVGTGFHPELTGRENIYLSGAIFGMTRAEIRRKFDEIVEFSEIAKFLDTPVKRFSSGMFVRLAFGVAAHMETEILLVDEVLAVGDLAFQRKSLGRMEHVAGEGRLIFFVSHNMQAVKRLCTRAFQLEQGRVVFEGATDDVVGHYLRSQEWDAESLTSGQQLGNDEDLRLLSMRVVNAEREAGGVFRSSEPISVELEFDAFRVGDDLRLGFDLVGGDGGIVLRAYQTDGRVEDWPTIRLGRNVLRGTIPRGLLNGGRFAVEPRAQMLGKKWIIAGGTRVSFDVVSDHSESPYGANVEPGCIAPALEWESVEG